MLHSIEETDSSTHGNIGKKRRLLLLIKHKFVVNGKKECVVPNT